jgi:hypothetical protein
LHLLLLAPLLMILLLLLLVAAARVWEVEATKQPIHAMCLLSTSKYMPSARVPGAGKWQWQRAAA